MLLRLVVAEEGEKRLPEPEETFAAETACLRIGVDGPAGAAKGSSWYDGRAGEAEVEAEAKKSLPVLAGESR